VDPKSDPALVVVFGATGDLMRRKLLPALARLGVGRQLHGRSRIMGVARRADLADAKFRAWACEAAGEIGDADEGVRRWCQNCLHYHAIGEGRAEDFRALAARITALEREHDLPGNRVFYLALPPQAFVDTITGLGQAGLGHSPGWTRLVIEKPFGRDLRSARDLNRVAHTYFDEEQVYRIDHYLGKETVQNLLVFRAANPIFESIWNRDRVESVQITVAEETGIEGRAGYYEQAGALRDMVQNHLMQILTLTAMDLPGAFRADAIRNEKVKVLGVIRPIAPGDIVLGQYGRGRINGQDVPGYREEPGVAPGSSVETFAALRAEVASLRWFGVPFYLRTGKRLPRRVTQVVVTFRCPPVSIFQPFDSCTIHSDVLAITIQPDEGFDLWVEVKTPGQPVTLQPQRLHFRYAEAFAPLADAYETLLLDVLIGDQTLFVRGDEVEGSWSLYGPVLEHRPQVHPYAAGTWGPPEAERFLLERGQRWFPARADEVT